MYVVVATVCPQRELLSDTITCPSVQVIVIVSSERAAAGAAVSTRTSAAAEMAPRDLLIRIFLLRLRPVRRVASSSAP